LKIHLRLLAFVRSTLLGQIFLLWSISVISIFCPNVGFRFFAVPAKVKAFGTFPVRAFGLIEEKSRK
jgi:hypothetical protein